MASKVKRRTRTGKSNQPKEHAAGTPQFIVTGVIRDANGALVEDAIVVAYDKDMRSEQVVGEGRTRHGRFTIAYTAKQFGRAEKTSNGIRATGSGLANCITEQT